MSDKTLLKLVDLGKNSNSGHANKENDPKGASLSEKQIMENDENKHEDEIKLDIGEHYHVKRIDDSWRMFLILDD